VTQPGVENITWVDTNNCGCNINKPGSQRTVNETRDVRNCKDDNCNLKVDEFPAVQCCNPGSLYNFDGYICGQAYPVIDGQTPPPGKSCTSDSASAATCFDGTCALPDAWGLTSCAVQENLCTDLEDCTASSPVMNTPNSCNVDVTVRYRNVITDMMVATHPTVNKLRGATCGLGCAQQSGCFGTFSMTDPDGQKSYGDCSLDPYLQTHPASCGATRSAGVAPEVYFFNYRNCSLNPYICSQPNAGRCADDGGPCTAVNAANGICDFNESCTAPDCAAAGYAVQCPMPQCVGPVVPPNATLCAGDDTNLSANTTLSLVPACTPSTKCEYTCSNGYALSGGVCVLTSTTWDGYLIDGGYPADGRTSPFITDSSAHLSIDGATPSTFSNGYFSLTVSLGQHVAAADAPGYDPVRDTYNITLSSLHQNITLYPASCTESCSLAGLCNYDCVAEGVCSIFNYSIAYNVTLDPARVRALCQGKPLGALMLYNASYMYNATSVPTNLWIRCCAGAVDDDPLRAESSIQVPYSLQTCSAQVVPQKRLVSLYGRIYELTVLSYRPCER
jgi:hypothetical protein